MAQELEVNRNLINPQFNSYRLCPDLKWPIISSLFSNDYGTLQSLELGQDDYSFVHVSMASSVNNLYHDPSFPGKVFFITCNGLVILAHCQENSLEFHNSFRIPDYDSQNTYASMSFISSSLVLILRSKRFENEKFSLDLLIINRSQNESTEAWNLEAIFPVQADLLYDDNSNLQQSSHMHIFDTGHWSDNTLTLIFASINKLNHCNKVVSKGAYKSKFFSVLYWLTLEKNVQSNCLTVKNYRRLVENGLKSDWPKYVALNSNGLDTNLIIVGEGIMKFYDIITDGCRQSQDFQNELDLGPDQPKNFSMGILINEKNDEECSNFNLQMEECDLQDFHDSLILSIIDGKTGNILVKFDLTGHQWLSSLSNLNNNPPFFVIRHDVDAFIYEIQKCDTNQYQVKHVGVFDALGYIQASKTRKRFITMSGNENKEWTHAIIADSDRNLFVYWKNKDKNNRNGHQTILQLQDNSTSKQDSVQGVYPKVDSKLVYVLTNNHLWLIKFEESQQQ